MTRMPTLAPTLFVLLFCVSAMAGEAQAGTVNLNTGGFGQVTQGLANFRDLFTDAIAPFMMIGGLVVGGIQFIRQPDDFSTGLRIALGVAFAGGMIMAAGDLVQGGWNTNAMTIPRSEATTVSAISSSLAVPEASQR